MCSDSNLLFSYQQHDNEHGTATVTIKDRVISSVYSSVILEQQKDLQAVGFAKGMVPISYIESTCKSYILDHLKEFFFNHSIITFLYTELYKNKIITIGEPLLTNIFLEPSKDAYYHFTVSTINPQVKQEWKKFPFKMPGRKNYKDLDRQVETFIQEESKPFHGKAGIQMLDWVYCVIHVITNNPLHPEDYKSYIWLKIGREDSDRNVHDMFLNKQVNDTFVTKNSFFQQYFSKKLDTNYTFEITILDHVSADTFSLDLFKHHFKIKNVKELHQKFIEIFSFRNDISQRREIVESAFKTLFKYYPISIPLSLIKQQENFLLKKLRKNPDYLVYKAQKDFNQKISLLAEKQLKEMIIIDQIAAQEQMSINPIDVQAFLNMLQRKRTKEFIHFDLPSTQLSGQEQPLPSGIINQACLREKTLNHIIHKLSSAA